MRVCSGDLLLPYSLFFFFTFYIPGMNEWVGKGRKGDLWMGDFPLYIVPKPMSESRHLLTF